MFSVVFWSFGQKLLSIAEGWPAPYFAVDGRFRHTETGA